MILQLHRCCEIAVVHSKAKGEILQRGPGRVLALTIASCNGQIAPRAFDWSLLGRQGINTLLVTPYMTAKISIITPLYMSAPYIKELHRRSVEAVYAAGLITYEIIYVNDGSPDDSLGIAREVAARDPHVIVIDLSRNFGQHRATLEGLARSTGDLIFIMDSDLEEEPEWIALFRAKMQESGADVVYGIQTARKTRLYYRASRRAFYFLLNALSDLRFPRTS